MNKHSMSTIGRLRARINKKVSVIPFKLIQTPDEQLLARVESAKRQRQDEIRELAMARMCEGLERHEENQALYARLEHNLQQDIRENSKTPRQKQLDRLHAEKLVEVAEQNRVNIAMRRMITPPPYYPETYIASNAEDALNFKRLNFR